MYKKIHGTGSGKGSGNPDPVDRETAITRSKEFVNELLSLNLHLRKAILFGSFVRNRQKEWSDIDIALIADEFIGFGYEDRKYFAKINILEPYSMIQTKTYGTEYFEKGDPFIEEILNTGILLYPA
jgi:uncharacterized protein